ncbi:MAG: DUF4919 domain-containing protein [Cytophagales bacterium]|nr:DUF4919 domain-containing protein [Cytophaga sp.]
MRKAVICIGLSILFFAAQAQTDSAAIVQKLAAKGGYTALSKRFIESDTTLTISDFKLIYYGFQYSGAYSPIETEINENLIKPYNKAGQYADAIQIADSVLLQKPVSITAHFEKAFACAQSGNTTLERYHNKRYIVLCNVIKSSGDGSKESPFKALSVNDALEVLNYIGLQAINDRKTETGLIEFDLAKNKSKLMHLYFSIPIQAYIAPDNTPDSE